MNSYNNYRAKPWEDFGFQEDMAAQIIFSLEENLANEMLQNSLLAEPNLSDPKLAYTNRIQTAEMMTNNLIEVAAEVANFFGPEEAEAFLGQMLASTRAGMSIDDLNREINQFFSNLAN